MLNLRTVSRLDTRDELLLVFAALMVPLCTRGNIAHI